MCTMQKFSVSCLPRGKTLLPPLFHRYCSSATKMVLGFIFYKELHPSLFFKYQLQEIQEDSLWFALRLLLYVVAVAVAINVASQSLRGLGLVWMFCVQRTVISWLHFADNY
ncbi:hypothetical protein EJ08DRAFT_393944 [Tothia fuscella]|uniref:Uncharacterized protein n=1 Tax=Tothia fuscella TaxID=1048955 RepID=A0A9P4U346_9PEZI|nr:hypothetical protein EJ08DRAFT_393944 [Tothia fuscella]